ncbi:DUF1800 domain-containing protein [Lysobacter sp. TY2-98]|uniref:DUF1800 domain-containing protein n=1 Tax=Lysobacter sp. TY2-98 TaxID=2290922 RepID=UPI000E2010BE|nr:DUF1800 domain-containing protein [Lysobacter sp. TY2-98]AXK71539.1 DUF1800 domain-containing protein [Lysobacter sp. TY2-98]
MTDDLKLASAYNRFGLGARPGDLDHATDPHAVLARQLSGDVGANAFSGLPASTDYLHREAVALAAARQNKRMRDDPGMSPMQDDAAPTPARQRRAGRGELREAVRAELDARYRHAATTPDGFAERLVRFWSNHFAVSLDKRPALLYAAPMEREAIRPNVFGHFDALLQAVASHPAMLRYLDNTRSVGDDSRIARRLSGKRELGLNENLAREILELHTLGVDGGYTQTDVTELARAITGWSTPAPREAIDSVPSTAFVFRPNAHEGGARRVLGRMYADSGVLQGRAILRDLAVHPATARHVSNKLARHFVADDPPKVVVDRMAQAWTRSGGALVDVYRALIDSPEAWAPDARKFRTPDDFLVAALRAMDASQPIARLQPVLTQLGEPAFTPRSPAGFPDVTTAWSGGDALFKRIQAAQRLASLPVTPDPLATARIALGAHLDDATATTLRRAESARSGLALLFASPAFQWRT